MEFHHLLKLARTLKTPKILTVNSNSHTFAFFNMLEAKTLSAYVFSKRTNSLEHIRDFILKKKILQLWQNGDAICLIDKFGDVYQLPLSYLNAKVDNRIDNNSQNAADDKIEDIKQDNPLSLITNLFAVIISICPLPSQGTILLSDDYYRIKLLSTGNLQAIQHIYSLRSCFTISILTISDSVLFFFDDGKVLVSTTDQLTKLDKIFSEEMLIELSTGLPEGVFYSDIRTIENDKICGWFYDAEAKQLHVHIWNYDNKSGCFIKMHSKIYEKIEQDFALLEDGKVLHTMEDDIDLTRLSIESDK